MARRLYMSECLDSFFIVLFELSPVFQNGMFASNSVEWRRSLLRIGAACLIHREVAATNDDRVVQKKKRDHLGS